jgi:hypothetical protein
MSQTAHAQTFSPTVHWERLVSEHDLKRAELRVFNASITADDMVYPMHFCAACGAVFSVDIDNGARVLYVDRMIWDTDDEDCSCSTARGIWETDD